MADDTGLTVFYGIEFPCRTLCAVHGGVEDSAFVVGTQTLRDRDNQIHYVRLDSSGSLHSSVYCHSPGEIWHLSSCPTDHRLLATCFCDPRRFVAPVSDSAGRGDYGGEKSRLRREVALWRLPADVGLEAPSGGDPVSNITQLCTVTADESLCCVHWCPGDNIQLLSAAEHKLIVWSVDAARQSTETVAEVACHLRRGSRLTAAKWNPHHPPHQVVAIGDASVRGFDLRSTEQTWSLDHAPGGLIRDVDFNPFNQYVLATGGDDATLRVWDIRKLSGDPVTPLHQLLSHSHGVWTVRYNPFHDRLVLTSSSDCQLHVSSLLSVSCERHDTGQQCQQQLTDPPADTQPNSVSHSASAHSSAGNEDGVCVRYDDHEDSVYAAEWSSCDAWSLASVSYDGRLVLRTLPDRVRNDTLT